MAGFQAALEYDLVIWYLVLWILFGGINVLLHLIAVHSDSLRLSNYINNFLAASLLDEKHHRLGRSQLPEVLATYWFPVSTSWHDTIIQWSMLEAGGGAVFLQLGQALTRSKLQNHCATWWHGIVTSKPNWNFCTFETGAQKTPLISRILRKWCHGLKVEMIAQNNVSNMDCKRNKIQSNTEDVKHWMIAFYTNKNHQETNI